MAVDELPSGVVTLVVGDVEGSARLWDSQPEQMRAALAQLDRIMIAEATALAGVRVVQLGEGDSFVIAFARASDAVGCALGLVSAALEPIRLRIAIHTGEVWLREPGGYMGPTVNRAVRLRELAHGGQVVLSGTTGDVVTEALPARCWLTDLGSYRLGDLPRPERVAQLCHPELRTRFPPPRAATTSGAEDLPAWLTSFVGRRKELTQLCAAVSENRLVTLTGVGGIGKTRLAIKVAATLADAFDDGVCYVDLAAVSTAAMVPVQVTRTLGLSDQPGRSTMQVLVGFIADKTMLVLIDNCEHLLEGCAPLIDELLRACERVRVVCTSREPLGVPGEVIWRVPALSLEDEAVELFTDRAQKARPGFTLTGDDVTLAAQICERLDGMPLAIEFAAARVRALSLTQICQGLNDRFGLLTGGARTVAPRQQTLRASMDWSHSLLPEPERVLLYRLAVFVGGFDLDAATVVGPTCDSDRSQLLDHLSSLVDKSLVVAEDAHGAGMRYRLLETVRQYAQEKLGASGEAEQIRARHRDYYATRAAELEAHMEAGDLPAIEQAMGWVRVEIGNLRAGFTWSRETGDDQAALELVSALQPFWVKSGRFREGHDGFEAILTDQRPTAMAPQVWVRAVADQSILSAWLTIPASTDRAAAAVAIARELDDPALITRALIGRATEAMYVDAELALTCLAEALDLARAQNMQWSLCQVRGFSATTGSFTGDLVTTRAAADEGRRLADALGDRFLSRFCRSWLSLALTMQAEFAPASQWARSAGEEAETAGDLPMTAVNQTIGCVALAHHGEIEAAHAAAESALTASQTLGGTYADVAYAMLSHAALAGGDAAAAREAAEMSWQYTIPLREAFVRAWNPMAEATLACGEVTAARHWADDDVAMVPGAYQAPALTVRALIATAQGELGQAERDAHESLAVAAETLGYMRVADTLECLARLATVAANHPYAARLLGAAHAIRAASGQARFPMHQSGYDAAWTQARDALGQIDFEVAYAEGAALSTEEAIAYAQRGRGQRGRGQRGRPNGGWESLTRAEHDVAGLVAEGLTNKDIAATLFISPKTVEAHLTHIYAKLNLKTRTQLTREVTRHS